MGYLPTIFGRLESLFAKFGTGLILVELQVGDLLEPMDFRTVTSVFRWCRRSLLTTLSLSGIYLTVELFACSAPPQVYKICVSGVMTKRQNRKDKRKRLKA